MKKMIFGLALIAATSLFCGDKKVSVFGCSSFMDKCRKQAIARFGARFQNVAQKMTDTQHHDELMMKVQAMTVRSLTAHYMKCHNDITQVH